MTPWCWNAPTRPARPGSSPPGGIDGETLLSVALITVEIEPHGSGSRLTLTNQIVALDGGGMITGSRHGWNAALDNLGEDLGS